MSFRKRNIALTSTSTQSDKPAQAAPKPQLPGVKPSSIDGRPVTSTGTASLDGLLAGHGGLALGCSLMIEENGSTDFAGALLKFYAAEGILQGHHVHVLGLTESWGRELPGTARESERKARATGDGEKMKIAWRYESLGQFGASTAGARDTLQSMTSSNTTAADPSATTPYNHTFDLSKRLIYPASASITFHPFTPSPTPTAPISPYTSLLNSFSTALKSHPTTPHRLIIPSLLSPLLYPTSGAQPQHLLTFLHTLRALLASTPTPLLTILTTLPLSLSPRSTGLTRWIELLHDGVIELSPFPHSADTLFNTTNTTGSASSQANKTSSGVIEEPPQGLLKVHKLPILTDRGSGVPAEEDDWAFTLSRRRLTVKAWRLGPVDGDDGGGGGGGGGGNGHEHVGQDGAGKAGGGKAKKEGMEF